MDTTLAAALATLVASSPNLLIAIWVIVRTEKRIDDLLASQKWLIGELMKLHPPQDEAKPPVVLRDDPPA